MGSPDPPQTPNPSKSYEQGFQIYLKYLPQMLAAEQEARTTYDPQRIAEQQGLQTEFGPTQYQQQLDAFQQLDPTYLANREQTGNAISTQLAAGSSLTPDEESQIENYTRAAQAARGNILGNAPATAEAYAKGDRGLALQQQRISNALSFQAEPTLPQLMTSIAPVSADRSFSFVDPNAGFQGQNFALQNYQNVLGAQSLANYNPWGSALGGAASGAAAGSSLGPYGAIIGGVAGGVGGYFSSDRRLKEDIKWTGVSPDGHNIYSFRYKGYNAVFSGAMADEVAHIPGVVAYDPDGFALVDYSKIDVPFRKLS